MGGREQQRPTGLSERPVDIFASKFLTDCPPLFCGVYHQKCKHALPNLTADKTPFAVLGRRWQLAVYISTEKSKFTFWISTSILGLG